MSASTVLGTVVALRRHPVKSMMGEELPAAVITESGVLGDRAHAGRCTDGIPSVFRLKHEPWIDPNGANPDRSSRGSGRARLGR